MWINKTIISEYISQAALNAFSVSQAGLNLELAVWIICWFLKRNTKFKGGGIKWNMKIKCSLNPSEQAVKRGEGKVSCTEVWLERPWAALGGPGTAACGEASGACLCAELQGQEGNLHAEQWCGHTVATALPHAVALKPFLNPAVRVLSPPFCGWIKSSGVRGLARLTESGSRRTGTYFNQVLILE